MPKSPLANLRYNLILARILGRVKRKDRLGRKSLHKEYDGFCMMIINRPECNGRNGQERLFSLTCGMDETML